MTKQKSLIRYILIKLSQKNAVGLLLDPDQVTIEHLAPENASGKTSLSDLDIASIGNLVLVTQTLNNQLANKNFGEKVAILKECNSYVDPFVLNAKKWGPEEIELRAKLLAKDAYERVWSL